MIRSRKFTGTVLPLRRSIEIEWRNPAPTALHFVIIPNPMRPHIRSSIDSQRPPHWIETIDTKTGIERGTRVRASAVGGARDEGEAERAASVACVCYPPPCGGWGWGREDAEAQRQP
jgi:hypothetical protein